MKTRFFSWVLLLLCLKVSCFANKDNVLEINDQVIEYFITTGDLAIELSQDGSKVYLDSDKISSRKDGLFIQAQNGEEYRIPMIFSSEEGCYILSSNSPSDSTIYPVIRCKSCDKPFSPSIFNKGVCPHCGTKN